MRVRKFKYFILGFGLFLSWINLPGFAQAPLSEYRLKAAFVYNFAKFIDWPPEAFKDDTAPFVIGILGDNPFGKNLEETVDHKTINTHPIKIQVFNDPADAAQCHLLFISKSNGAKIPEIIKKLQGTTVLTVSETDRFIEQGGMINFVEESKKVRFQINDDAAKVAKLRLSSKLLSLAVPVSR